MLCWNVSCLSVALTNGYLLIMWLNNQNGVGEITNGGIIIVVGLHVSVSDWRHDQEWGLNRIFSRTDKGRLRTRSQDEEGGQSDRQDVGYRLDLVEKGRKVSTRIFTEGAWLVEGTLMYSKLSHAGQKQVYKSFKDFWG